MTAVIVIEPGGDERRLPDAEFPVPLDARRGLGETGTGIEPAGWLGQERGELFVQPASPPREPITCNGAPVTASQWLRDGDSLRVGPMTLRVTGTAGALRLQIERVAAPTTGHGPVEDPLPAIVSGTGQPPERRRPPEPILIRPIEYVPRSTRRPARRRLRLRPGWIATVALLGLLAGALWLMFTLRSVELQVEPQPDRLTVSGPTPTWSVGGRHLLRPGTYHLVAEKDGYRRLDEPFEVGDASHQTFAFTLTLLPGRLAVQASVAEAEVLIDGEPRGQAPLDTEVSAGDHRLTVRAEGYSEFTTTVTVRGGGEIESVSATLVPTWSPVTFRSSPAGADVRVGGEVLGQTPLTTDLKAGKHVYELRLAGYRSVRATVDVQANTPLEIPVVDLKAADGSLRVTSDPPGAVVTIDGSVKGQTPLEIDVAPGTEHTVAVSKAGHDDASRSVQVASGETKQIALSMTPRTGTVVFAADPADAELVLDGTSRGRADQTLDLPAVPHEVEIRRQGYETYRTGVTPRPGFEQAVRVTLKTAAQVHAEKTPPVYVSKNEHRMILIDGGRFTMGASRREPGRRANETLREVEITRRFYMSATEVSNEQFRAFQDSHVSGAGAGFNLENDHHPVVRVTWTDAAMYCNWLSLQEGRTPVYDFSGGLPVAKRPFGDGYRLPTEAEWAWAARYTGGRQTRKYPWGDALPIAQGSGNYADGSSGGALPRVLPDYTDGYPATAPVDSFPPGPLGLYNLGGNVAEWVHDFYTVYPPGRALQKDPTGPDEGELHVIRGASWMDAALAELRLSYRDYGADRRPDVGFRVARSAE